MGSRPAGLIATGKSFDVVEKRIQSAVETHLAGMREDGVPNRRRRCR